MRPRPPLPAELDGPRFCHLLNRFPTVQHRISDQNDRNHETTIAPMDSKVIPRSEGRLSPGPLRVSKSPTSGAASASASASPENLPAAQQLGEVVSTTLGNLVRLPPRFAK